MTEKTNSADAAASMAEALAAEAKGDRTLADSLTPIERALVSITPILLAFERIKIDAEAGVLCPAGVYVKDESSPILVPGAPDRFQCVGVKIPLEFVREIVDAHLAARRTPYGERLAAKILAFRKPANARPD